MLCHLMQNKLCSVVVELEKDRCKGVEMRELNNIEKFTSHAFLRKIHLSIQLGCLNIIDMRK